MTGSLEVGDGAMMGLLLLLVMWQTVYCVIKVEVFGMVPLGEDT